MRLDIHLAQKYPHYSRSHLQKLIKSGAVLVNNKIVTPHYQLKPTDKITENLTPPEKINLSPDASIKLDIIYEDANYLVVNKPPGLIVHPSESAKSRTLVNALLAYYPPIKNIGDKKSICDFQFAICNHRPGIVHRLDRTVSGLMVVAKTQAAFNNLKLQFQNRKIKKEYTALVYGNVSRDQGEINLAIGRSKKGNKMSARTQPKEKDKAALTRYRVIKRFKNFTLLKIQTLTGRTHQIRVHLHAIGHPIVNDPLYKSKSVKKEGSGIRHQASGPRLFLHADFLEFRDLNNQPKTFKLTLPKELKNILEKLQ